MQTGVPIGKQINGSEGARGRARSAMAPLHGWVAGLAGSTTHLLMVACVACGGLLMGAIQWDARAQDGFGDALHAGGGHNLTAEQARLMATHVDGVDRDRVVVRFTETPRIRFREGRWVAIDAPQPTDVAIGPLLAELESILARTGVESIGRRVAMSAGAVDAMRRAAEERCQATLPDMNRYYELHLAEEPNAAAARARLVALLAELNALPIVEVAFAAPIPEPSGAAIAAGSVPTPAAATTAAAAAGQDRLPTPDFSAQQGYLYAAPIGVEADVAWTYAGGLGAGVKVIDIEFGWRFTHEDLKPPFYTSGDPGVDDHGTAVIGEICGQHNGFGVNGIAPDVEIGGASINSQSVAGAILHATAALDPGDIFIIELHAIGPFGNYVPMEFWQDNFDAIQIASALGVICCEAAGNGTQDLDFEGYAGLFDRRVRDSGAIMCGAGTPAGLDAEWFSNYGTRVDLQGWGSSVTTTGYGDLYNNGPDAMYTAGFNGTSSATPIVSGSVASLQGQALELFTEPLTPALAQEILSRSGSAWQGDRQIGERPDLATARGILTQGYANLWVTVRDAETQLPLPGMVVEIVETGRILTTNQDGQCAAQMSAGAFTLHLESFFYLPTDVEVLLVAGEDQVLSIDLPARPQGMVGGTVWLEGLQQTVADARVHPLHPFLSDVTSGPDGSFVIDQIPEAEQYRFTVGGVAGLSNGFATLAVLGDRLTAWHPVLVPAQDFEADDGGFAATGLWEWGTPAGQGPGGAFSGSKCWATRLLGPYPNYSFVNLDSPVYPLAGAEQILLSLHHWYWIDEFNDGGNVQIFFDGAWHVVEPFEGYDSDRMGILAEQPGFTGDSGGWVDEIFDVSAYASDQFRIRFRFCSGPSGVGPGWYIDDVALDTGAGFQDIALDPGDPAVGAQIRLLQAPAPNPMVAQASIVFHLPEPDQVEVTLHDAQGRRVATLAEGLHEAGRHQLSWSARDEQGHTAPAGAYYIRLKTASGRSEVRPLIHVR